MNPLLQQHAATIAELCVKHHVQRLYVFGSAARDDFDPQRSDLDFLVEFLPLQTGERATHFFALQADLQKLFGRAVDLGEPAGIRNRIVRESIKKSMVSLYAAA